MNLYCTDVKVIWPNQDKIVGLTHVKFNVSKSSKGVNINQYKSKPDMYTKLEIVFSFVKLKKFLMFDII